MITTNIHGVMHTTVQRHEHTASLGRFDTLEISVYGPDGLLTTINLFVKPGQWLSGISESPAKGLIEAAPDLLAALQAMLDEDDGGMCAPMARAAISKATKQT